jgi:signal transduction histidine kinase/CheY-like chemotaxis protein/HPt (histidine-containing phosphotransfer) domain-containing protein
VTDDREPYAGSTALRGMPPSSQDLASGGARDQTADERDQKAGTRDDTADIRDQTADVRDLTGHSRDASGDRRDQTADVRDRAGSQRDQAAGERDDTAGERDQAGNDRDRHGDLRDHTADVRDQAGQQRDDTADLRDHTADVRDRAGSRRDETAGARDVTADLRDQAAGHRDEAAGHRDLASDQRDQEADRRDKDADRRELAANAGLAEASDSPSALARREAASDRVHASRDRRAGASDRTQAEHDRSTALADRDAGADERNQAERDRSTALADRDAGADERNQAERDRGTALADRDAAAGERGQAERDRATALADRGASARDRAEQVRLDAISRSKSEFLSRMSHELRTPLNAILGFGQLLELDALSAEQRDSAEQISKAGRHLLRLVNEVLDISQVENGELRLALEPVSLRQIVSESLGMLRPLAAARGVRLHIAASSVQEHVRADRSRLEQVVVNLLANAVKYNGTGGEVNVSWDPVGAERMRLVVADTGVGIADRDLARLFMPFDRLGAEQTDVEGSGLGLSVTKQLVEAMGGDIGATSRRGVGSSFWVELPLADAPRDQPPNPEAAPPPAPASAGPRTVLYVEDNVSNVKLVERIVARRPEVTLIVAMRGRLGLHLALRHRPELVLLDLHLPDLSGEEVLQHLRADPRTSATPVVVLSADATEGQVQRLRANGATDYLTKPFDIPRLLAVIDGTGGLQQPAPAVSRPPTDAGAEPLDPTIIESLHELGRDSAVGAAGIRSLVTTFLDDSASRLADLRVALGRGDTDGTERLAHSLAGSSANVGAHVLAAGCRELEERARAGTLDDATGLWPQVDEAFTDAHAALRAEFLRRGEPRP